MKTILIFAIAAIGMLARPISSHAQITISNFQLTQTSLAFDISGNLPSPGPSSSQHGLIFANPSILEDPGFALGELITTHNVSFSGSQLLEFVATGVRQYGDYFYLGFPFPFEPGEIVSGRVTAEWSETAFNPSAVSHLNVFWGSTSFGLADSGVLLTTVTVPEPSALCFLGLGLLVLGRNLFNGRQRCIQT